MAKVNGLPKVAALGRFDNLGAIRSYEGDLLVIHGRDDQILPFEMGAKLYTEAATLPERKRFVPLNAGHNDLLSRHKATLTDHILRMR